MELKMDEAEEAIARGDLTEAQAALMMEDERLLPDELRDTHIDFFDLTPEQIAEDHAEVLIKFPGFLGRTFSHHFARGRFVAFQAPEKTGKTWWLLYCAYKALHRPKKKGLSVAFFCTGDMSQVELARRLCGIYLKSSFEVDDGDYLVCTGVKKDVPQYEMKRIKKLDPEDIKQIPYLNPNYDPKKTTKGRGKLLVKSWPPDTIRVADIHRQLEQWKSLSDFIPDIIVVDYADLMIGNAKEDFRHRQNEIWKGLRALSQTWKALVITATQSDIKAEGRIQTRANFSEDKRKYAHITSMIGLNRVDPDLEAVQLNVIAQRHGRLERSVAEVFHTYEYGKICAGSRRYMKDRENEE